MSYDEWLLNCGIEPAYKAIRLEQVRYGETFKLHGWTFTVLDHIAGGVFCISHARRNGPFWSHDAFDDECCNSLAVANIGNFLEDFVSHMKEDCDMGDDVLPMFVNLKDTAGVRAYGLYECDGGLLTLEECASTSVSFQRLTRNGSWLRLLRRRGRRACRDVAVERMVR